MIAELIANGLVLLHFAFILFVAVGAFLVLRWPSLAYAHVPCLIWGIAIELGGFICPLTPLEVELRLAAGRDGYSGGFIDHYIMPLVYPPGLTRAMQILLGLALLAVNGLIYGYLIVRRRHVAHPAHRVEAQAPRHNDGNKARGEGSRQAAPLQQPPDAPGHRPDSAGHSAAEPMKHTKSTSSAS